MSGRAVRAVGIVLGLATLLAILLSATLVDRRGPSVERIAVSRVAESGLALTHAAIDVQFSEPVVERSAEIRFRIAPAIDGSFSWDGARTLIFTPDDRLPLATEIRVWLEPGFADLAGNVAERGADPFVFTTVDLPEVIASDPTDGGRDVPTDGTLSVTFDRLMDTELTTAALRLEPAAALLTAWRGATLLVTPDEPLEPGRRYRLVLDASAADADGNEIGRTVEIEFTTIAAGLEAVAVIPADGSAGAPLDGPIAVLFDRPVETDGADAALRLTPQTPGSTQVLLRPNDSAGPLETADPGGELVVFRPSSALAANTTYTVELVAGSLRTVGGGQAAAGRTWSFTTGSGAGSIQNQIVFISERGGISNVWAMNPDGTNARQLTTELAPVTAYDLAQDGSRVAYAAGGAVALLSLLDARRSVVTPDGQLDYAPRFVPDNSALVVGRRERESGTDLGWWLVPLDGGAPRQLLPTGAPPTGSTDPSAAPAPQPTDLESDWTTLPAVSEDGAFVLLVDEAGMLRLVAVADGTVLETGLSGRGQAAWIASADGFLAPARRSGESATSWFIRPGQAPAPGPRISSSIAAEPRGAITALDVLGRHLVYLASQSLPPVPVTDATSLERSPAFAPGGGEIVFVRVAPEDPTRSEGIWVVGIDGEGLRRLAPTGSAPRWVP